MKVQVDDGEVGRRQSFFSTYIFPCVRQSE